MLIPKLSEALIPTEILPEIWAPDIGFVIDTVGNVVSILTDKEAELGEILPAASTAFAVMACVMLEDSAVVGVADHEPVLVVVVVTNGVVLEPSYSLTVEDASAEPVNVGVLSLVVLPLRGLDIEGAVGARVSTVMLIAVEAGDMLPAASTAFAVML